MTPVEALLDRFRELDVRLEARGDKLKVNAPKGVLTPELAGELKRHKGEVLAFLRQARSGKAAPPVTPAPRNEPLPLSFAQERLWFLDRLQPGSPAYNVPLHLSLRGRLRPAALARALSAVAERHEVLRTTLEEEEGEGVQVIHPPAPVPLPVIDLSGLSVGSPGSTLGEDPGEGSRWNPGAEPGTNQSDGPGGDPGGKPGGNPREEPGGNPGVETGGKPGGNLGERLGWNPNEEPAPARQLAEREARRLFDLSRGPLLRAVLLRLGGESHRLLVTLHHVVTDGWSMGVLVAETAAFYRAALEGEAPPLPELAFQYADFALWQRRWLEGEELERQLAFWRRQLEGAPPALELPTDRPHPLDPSPQGASVEVRCPAALTKRLESTAMAHGATPFMVLLAAFAALLGRLAGQRDVVTGVPVANRHRGGVEGLIGFFVNTLALRLRWQGDPAFVTLLEEARRQALAAFEHQDLPFERLVEDLAVDRQGGRSPVFQAMLVVQNLQAPPARELELPGLVLEPVEAPDGTAKLDLTLTVSEAAEESGTEAGLALVLQYRSGLFDETTARRLLEAFRRTLTAALAAPGRRLSALPWTSPAQRHQLLAEWSRCLPTAPMPGPLVADPLTPGRPRLDAPTGEGRTQKVSATSIEGRPAPGHPARGASAGGPILLHEGLLLQVRRQPEATAVVALPRNAGAPDGARTGPGADEVRLSFQELADRSAAVAARLQALGVGIEDRVALLLPRSAAQLVAVFGILRTGAAYVPVEPSTPPERRAYLLEDCEARAVITTETLAAELPKPPPLLLLDSTGRSGQRLALPTKEDPDGKDTRAEGALEDGPLEGEPLDPDSLAVADPPEAGVTRGGSASHSFDGGAGTPSGVYPENLAYVIYTSGSTGRPKGVGVSHGSALGLLAALRATVYRGAGPGLKVSLNAPLAFDASVQQWLQLLDGHCLYVVDEETRRDPGALVAFAARTGLDVLDGVPSHLAELVAAGLLASPESSPKRIIAGGEEIPAGLWRRLSAGPAEVFNVYGPTECTVDATTARLDPGDDPHLGRPLAGDRIYVLDDRLDPLPLGAAGELCIAGAGLARGYFRRPGRTAAAFVPHPFSGRPGERLYRTGDRAAFRRDGCLRYLGRLDHQVKLRGFRIELGEVEAALLAHPKVAAAAVAVRPRPGGAGPRDQVLVAYVVWQGTGPESEPEPDEPDPGGPDPDEQIQGGPLPDQLEPDRPDRDEPDRDEPDRDEPDRDQQDRDEPDRDEQDRDEQDRDEQDRNEQDRDEQDRDEPDWAELRAFLRRRLPEAMVPGLFQALPALPRTAAGKIDRRSLPEPARGERPKAVAPRTPMEALVAEAFREVLGTEVGAEDDFFALGGHSLLAIRAVARLGQALGQEVSLAQLFRTSRVDALAAWLDSSKTGAQAGTRAGTRAGTKAPPLEAVDRSGDVPLSFAQERLFFLHHLDSGSPVYHVPLGLRLRGDLDADRLEAALVQLVQRHEALRTRFSMSTGKGGGRPVQRVQVAPRRMLRHLNLQDLPPVEREEEARRRAWEEIRRPFDLAAGRPFRALLLRLREDDHALVVTLHHIVSDGWSMEVFVRETALLYQRSPLPPLPVQYGDFAVWQRSWLEGGELERQLAYWKQALEEAPAAIDLPTDRPRPAVQTFAGASRSGRWGRDLREAVDALARRASATPFMALAAGFSALLARTASQSQVVLGTPIANRPRPELQDLMGFFVNTLALPLEALGSRPFLHHLEAVREASLGAFAHQDLPFERLVEALEAKRDLQRSPIFQVLLVAQSSESGKGPAFPGLEVEPLAVETGTAKYELSLSALTSPGEITLGLEYNRDLFDGTTAERLLRRLRRLLAAAAEAPETPLSLLPWLSPAECQQLVREWNDTEASFEGAPTTLHGWVADQARRAPEAVALRFEEEEITYADLLSRAHRLAHHLRSLGAGTEGKVGVRLSRSPELVIALLAVLAAGSAYVPLDPDSPAERVGWIAKDAGVAVIVTRGDLARGLEGAPPLLLLDEVDLGGLPATAPEVAVEPGSLAYVIYTSGSTGRPKGVLGWHGGIVNRLRWMLDAYRPGPGDTVLLKTPFTFDVSVWEVFWPLVTGACLAGTRPGGHREPAYLSERIEAEGVTIVHFVPSMLEAFLEYGDPDRWGSLRLLVCSGEALSTDLARRCQGALPQARILNLYGPTEASVDVTWHPCGAKNLGPPLPIGRPIANTSIHVVDGAFKPSPIGVPGELLIGGVQLARGYQGRPALTASVFVPDPFGEPGARLYRSGDEARHRADGAVEYLGRKDFQVKLRGVRIELGEIEGALAEHPAVARAVVLLLEGGAGGAQLVAYVVGRGEAPPPEAPAADSLPAASLTEGALRTFLSARLPAALVPSRFVVLESLPLTSSGKVDRKAFPVPGGPAGEPALTRAGGGELRDGLELRLAAIWQEVLEVPQVGLEEDFFHLGGHSLLALRLLSRMEEELGAALPVAALFRAKTIQAQARLLRRGALPTAVGNLVPLETRGSGPATFFVHPVGGNVLCYLPLVRRLSAGLHGPRPFYGLQSPGLEEEPPAEERKEEPTIPTLATLYLEEVRAKAGEAPLRLGGWSLGGVIAHEMACQAVEEGMKVEKLVLVDSFPARGRQAVPDEAGLLAAMLQDLAASAGKPSAGKPSPKALKDLRRATPEDRWDLALTRARDAELLPPDLPPERLRRLFEVFRINLQALHRHRPRPYSGSAVLVAAEGGGRRAELAWKPWIGDTLTVVELPGDHYSLLQEPNVAATAKAFREALG